MEYVQDGKNIDYVNGGSTDIKHGDVVVIGNHAGIAIDNIAVGDTGVITMEHVWDFDKDTSTAIDLGADLYWDAANKVATTVSSENTPLGYAVAAAATAASTVRVKLLG